MFAALKLVRFGAKQAKKHNAKRQQTEQAQQAQAQTQQPWPHPAYYYQGRDQPYPQDGYYTTSGDGHIPMPSTYTTATATGPPHGTAPEGSPPSESGSGQPSGREHRLRKTKTNLETCLRIIQFSLSLAVIGLYGQDIHPHSSSPPPAKWVFAVVVGFLGSVVSFVVIVCNLLMKKRPLALRPVARMLVFASEGLMLVLWVVVFGVFGGMYINQENRPEDEMEGKVRRMKRAVWVDVAVLGFGVVSASWMGVRWFRGRKIQQKIGEEEGKEME